MRAVAVLLALLWAKRWKLRRDLDDCMTVLAPDVHAYADVIRNATVIGAAELEAAMRDPRVRRTLDEADRAYAESVRL